MRNSQVGYEYHGKSSVAYRFLGRVEGGVTQHVVDSNLPVPFRLKSISKSSQPSNLFDCLPRWQWLALGWP